MSDAATDPASPAGRVPPVPPPTRRVEAVDVHPPTRLERLAYGAIRGLFAVLARPYFRLEIHGREHVPSHGPFVLAPVHRSNLDFILVSTLTRTRMRYMGKASIWKWSWGGRFVSMLGVGEPLVPPAGDGSGRVRRRVVRELTEQLKARVQTLNDEARRLAG